MIHLSFSVASALYFGRFMSEDLNQSLFAVLQIVGDVNIGYILVIALIIRRQITGIFKSLTIIYRARED